SGFFRQEPPGQRDKNFAVDPEAGISALHDKKEGPKLRNKDFDHEWRQQLKAWGYTQAMRQRRSEEFMDRAVQCLKAAGVWSIIERKPFTIEDREEIHRILTAKQPFRVLESSDGLTFYADQNSLWKDLHGESDI
ncbi:MAG: hypothetical protein ACC618_04475, partial [Patescibacteria group bacterium]